MLNRSSYQVESKQNYELHEYMYVNYYILSEIQLHVFCIRGDFRKHVDVTFYYKQSTVNYSKQGDFFFLHIIVVILCIR